ncbi:MAG: asparagine synthetase B family protein, partial [Thiobacillaceae bacterium]
MDGIFGWLGHTSDPDFLFDAMNQAMGCTANPTSAKRDNFGLAASSQFGRAHVFTANRLVVALHGRVRFSDPELQRLSLDQGPAAALARGWERDQAALLPMVHGAFALAVLDPHAQRGWLAIDRAGIGRLCFGASSGNLAFSSSVLAVAAHPALGRNIDLQTIFNYFYFHMIPSPSTLYRGVEKLLPGEVLCFDQGHVSRSFYWAMDYTPDPSREFPTFRERFRQHLMASVKLELDGHATGAFLSGGTDSSTVVGTLSEAAGHPVETFSIGFDAEGFDEMEYARIAARRFASHTHEYYLKPADIVSAIPVIAKHYDEPFGNESAVPTYFCAKLARDHGIDVMLAGDGGDEIFGGNARYAKQKVFEVYFDLPSSLRTGLIEPLAHCPGLSDYFPLRKLKSYVDQANVRLPDRLETYNFLHRSPLEAIFDRDFLATVDPASSNRQMRNVYERTNHPDPIKRMMHIDLKFTLADNDLRKVVTMCEAAG